MQLQTMRKTLFASFDYILYVDGNSLRDLDGKGNQAKSWRAKTELRASETAHYKDPR